MASVTVHYFANLMRSTRAELRPVEVEGGTIAEAAARAFPELDAERMVFVIDGHTAPADTPVREGMQIALCLRPGIVAGGVWATVGKMVITALVSAAVSYLISYIMRPKSKNKTASPAYSVNIEQNAARLGQTIPVIYGRVLAMPDIAAQSYAEYVNHNEQVSMILCLGMGEFDIHDIYLGDARITDFPAGNVAAWIFKSSDHQQRMGIIEAATGVVEDMYTIPETTGVDIAAPNDPAEVTIAGTVNGGTLTPDGSVAGTVWTGLVPGKRYVVTNSAGGVAVLTYVGIGPNNSAVFDGPLPAPVGMEIHPVVAQLIDATDTAEGDVKVLYANSNVPNVQLNDIIYVRFPSGASGALYGPYQIYKFTVGTTRVWMRRQGPGFTTGTDIGIWPSQQLDVVRNAFVTYSITEWTPDTPTAADPYRWRGWWATNRADTFIDRVYVDINMPSGLAWVTDKGDYNREEIVLRIQIQPIDANSSPTGAVMEFNQTFTGATSNPRRWTLTYNVPVGRYRVRIARTNTRDQRASKEISKAELSAIRSRLYHPYGTPAYEDCTLLVMKFQASSGLSAAANRRIKVDCTRKVPDINHGALVATSNPADIFCDVLENTAYGAKRPAAETDRAKLVSFRNQWATTAGFNAVFDSQITVIEALQNVVGVVKAIPLPIGNLISCAQDAPRSRSFIFSPANIVQDTLQIGYNFDGVDEPDCLELIYTDPATFVEARYYYPTQGVKPESMELFGCTSVQQAHDWAKLTWQERKANRRTAQLELEGEGYLLQPLTRFAVEIPVIDNGTSGKVQTWNPYTLRLSLDGPVPANATVIYFQGADGTVTQGAAIAARITDHEVVLANVPPVPVKGGDNTGDGTMWLAPAATSILKEFSVTDLEANGPLRVRVTGIEYSDAKYVDTFVQGWVT